MKAKYVPLGWLAGASLALGGGIAMASMSPAYAAVQTLQPGQVVDVQLVGPAKSTSSHVINITLHWGD